MDPARGRVPDPVADDDQANAFGQVSGGRGHRVDRRGITELHGEHDRRDAGRRLVQAARHRVAPAIPNLAPDAPRPAGWAGSRRKAVPESVTRQPAASISARSSSAVAQSRAARASERRCAASSTAAGAAAASGRDALPIVRRRRADDLVDDREVHVVEALEADAAAPEVRLREARDVRLEVQRGRVQRDVVLLRRDPEREPLALASGRDRYLYVPYESMPCLAEAPSTAPPRARARAGARCPFDAAPRGPRRTPRASRRSAPSSRTGRPSPSRGEW